ncbi:leucyl/phenylalanyl-tRNA--protein transferase [Yoonia litorea]|uniref:Leucyl/phenylalanyl-tRNA--protein transferase n=1 Tax=Yoonia litorea TaxID=1123755 RepID=A0A1I6LN70_9RHOB|nr:leucyl/phenylalanyl-tRNA--protein transferase [Yoonia litorea]SFS04692.1 leucyl/phenylalanyl-tRNA--protein transferase [Yoonia litorea]
MKDEHTLTPSLLLQAYQVGLFPMSEGRDDPEVFWVDPTLRGIFPLDGFRISRSLAKRLRKADYKITFDTAFEDVMRGCADRNETWINDTILDLYSDLYASGFAHSVEVWAGDELVGGVYGVSIGAAYFGESMFSRRTDASKIALAYLIDRLRLSGYQLFDTQFITPHLASLGAIEIPRAEYQRLLDSALRGSAQFDASSAAPSPQDVVQRNAQISYRG